MATNDIVIGIDLGTTNSVVAINQNGNIEIVANDQGNRITPSVVAFTDVERLVGEAAVYQAHSNPENTIFAAKRLIGRNFTDPDVQRDIKNFPFKVIEEDDQIKICVTSEGEEKKLFPEEILAAILGKMKAIAEAYIGTEIHSAVITVPAYFNDAQRQATKMAAEIAGLEVSRMINEPTAAALAYVNQLTSTDRGSKNFLIFDFGGGTFDVSIVLVRGKDLKVLTVNGDTHLGGEDIDNRMVKHYIELFKRKFDRDISDESGIKRQLRTQCERAKRILSTATQHLIKIEGTNLEGIITRARFEDMNISLFEKTIKLVDEAIKDAELSKNEINEVVLVGGSSRIPKIQELLYEYFGGKPLNKNINPDECVAYGAAIQAGLLQETIAEKDKALTLVDICHLSLGVELSDGSMQIYIPRKSEIPIKKTEILKAAKGNSTVVAVKIYEGERYMCEDNHFLGSFELSGICSAEKGGGKVEITFEIDANGILSVSALEPQTGVNNSITIINKNRLRKEDVNRIIAEEDKYRNHDEAQKDRVKAINDLENYCCMLKRTVTDMKSRIEIKETDVFSIMAHCDELLEWIDSNRSEAKGRFIEKRVELETLWKSMEDKYK